MPGRRADRVGSIWRQEQPQPTAIVPGPPTHVGPTASFVPTVCPCRATFDRWAEPRADTGRLQWVERAWRSISRLIWLSVTGLRRYTFNAYAAVRNAQAMAG
jgi:hypothetical protein